MKFGTKILATFFATVAIAAVLTVAAQRDSLVSLLERAAWNASRITHCSLEESKQRVKESAPLVDRYDHYGLLPHRTYGLLELENSAIDLAHAHTGNPDAEYLIGWMYQYQSRASGVGADADGICCWLDKVSNSNLFSFFFDEVNHSWEHRPGSAVNWYKQAAAHGSAPAAAEIGLMYQRGDCGMPQDYAQATVWYQRAIAQGDIEAKIDLGSMYEVRGSETDLRKAMEFYEQVTKAEDEGTVNRAIACVLDLWVKKHVIPSKKFAMGATDPFDFLSRFDSGGMDAKKYAEKFSYCVFSPDPNARYRWDLFAKVRHALGLFSYRAEDPAGTSR